jgi:hypothetical protein
LSGLTAFMLWAAASTVSAVEVKDDAHFFSADTLSAANARIEKLKDTYHRDVIVETYPDIPDKLKPQYKPENKNEFFATWYRDRARELRVNGIYILICKNPAHLQVGASSDLYKQGFTTADRDQLRNTLLSKFKSKEYDAGLMDSLGFISNRFDEMSKTHATTAKPGSSGYPPATGSRGSSGSTSGSSSGGTGLGWFSWLLILGGAFIVLRLILGAFRRAAYSRGGGPGGPGGYGPGGPGYGGPGYGGGGPGPGGGGFFSSMLGGLFGGVAGNWLGNRWLGGGSSHEAPPMGGSGSQAPEDYGSTGGDFGPGDNGGGGGGDFGGGDFGGGGGGDSGGGGGGGDF